jgi:hypothetical protein
MKLGLPQLLAVLESGLGMAPPRKLQGVPRGALLGQTEQMLIKASNHAEYPRDVEHQEEYFPREVASPSGGGS